MSQKFLTPQEGCNSISPMILRDYFGRRVLNKEESPLIRLKKRESQLDFFKGNEPKISLSVTDLWSALRCPWLFYHSYIIKSHKYPPSSNF